MFDELKKYKTNDHFFFTKGVKLSDVSKDVPELPGIYYIIRLAKGKVELVYISRSGTSIKIGGAKSQLLRNAINSKQEFLDVKLSEEKNIDGLDIYWFVTMDASYNDLPAYVEGSILQRFFDIYGRLPLWNKND